MTVAGSTTTTAALLLTDVEGSTRLWQEHPAATDAAMVRHHELVATVVAEHGGWLPLDQGEGDSRLAAFDTASAALRAGLDLQLRFASEPWPAVAPLKVRMAVHSGEVLMRDAGVHGETLSRAARLRDLGHGGQLLVSEAVYALLRDSLPGDVVLRDLGVHRMKDLTRPERVYQVVHPELPDGFRPLRSLDQARHNLPVQLSSFIGRTRELRELAALVEAQRLVTVTGPGGMGKTRTALQVAAALADGTGDGVHFVDLSPLRDPDLIAPTIAAVLDVHSVGGPSGGDGLAAYLADKRLLLLVDNLEHLLPTAADVVASLLAAGPRVHVLATSREPLRLRGEHAYVLEPLATPDDAQTAAAESVESFESVRLFVERAVAAKADFTVTTDSAPAVAAICARLDGLPLAIELAAARVAMLPPRALLARLSDRLGVLTGGARDLPTRQQTLRDAIAWSYELLSPGEQELFAALSVFAGGASCEAVESVGTAAAPSVDDVMSALQSLVEKSLVRQLESAAGEPRFHLLETVREFATEALSNDGARAQAARTAHAAHFHGAVEKLVAGRIVDATAIGFVELELDNLRSVLDSYREAGRTNDELQLLSGISDPLWHLGRTGEVLDRSSYLLSETTEPSEAVVELLDAVGVDAAYGGDLDAAADAFTRQARVAQELGAPNAEARAMLNMGHLNLRRGDHTAARQSVQAAIELAEQAPSGITRLRLFDRDRALAESYELGARVALDEGDWAAVLNWVDRGLPLVVTRDDPEVTSGLLRVRGDAWLGRRELDRAATDYAAALAAAGPSGMRVAAGWAAVRLADVALRQRRLDDADRWVGEAHAFAPESGMTRLRLQVDVASAEVLHARGESAAAVPILEKAVATRDAGAADVHLRALLDLAQFGAADEAAAFRYAARALSASLDARSGAASCLRVLGALDARRGDHKRALTLFVAAEGMNGVGPVHVRDLVPADPAHVESARAALDPTEAAQAVEAGARLTLEECVALLG